MSKASGAWLGLRYRSIGGTALFLGSAATAAYLNIDHDSEACLNPSRFTSFRLVDHDKVSPDCSLLNFVKHHQSSHDTDRLRAGVADAFGQGIWSIEIKQPQLMISRRYTPLPNSFADHDLSFLVRREAQGEVSRYLHKLRPGSVVEMRGPHVEYAVPPTARNIIFIAGGTGIAPALQVAETLKARGLVCKLSILWAVRRREECQGGIDCTDPLLKEDHRRARSWFDWTSINAHSERLPPSPPGEKNAIVKHLEHSVHAVESHLNMEVRYFVDEERRIITAKEIQRALDSPLVESSSGANNLVSRAPGGETGHKLVIVSGPDGFISAIAGSKSASEGVQGPIGGILAACGAVEHGWAVRKL